LNKDCACGCATQGQEVLVQDGRTNITIGGAGGERLVIKGNLISRLACSRGIQPANTQFMLFDQSTNGTFVLGKDGEEGFRSPRLHADPR